MKSLRVLLRQTMAVALLSLPLESFAGADRRIALTFDEGPQPGASGALLDELERLQIKASVFPASGGPDRFPGQGGTAAETGLVELAPPAVRGKIAGAARILRELGYRDSLALPPAFGPLAGFPKWLPDRGDAPTDRRGLLQTGNAAMEDPREIADYIADNAFPGAVVLLHPMYGQRTQLLKALPLIGEKLRARGYDFATLSEVVGDRKRPAGPVQT